MCHLVNAHSVTGPAGSIYRTSFTAIVHWIGCINAIKLFYKLISTMLVNTFKITLALLRLP